MGIPDLQHEILGYCDCDDEPLFALLKSTHPEGTASFLEAIGNLVDQGLLVWSYWDDNWRTEKLSFEDLQKYVKARLKAGENLCEPPRVVPEYAFRITVAGTEALTSEIREREEKADAP